MGKRVYHGEITECEDLSNRVAHLDGWECTENGTRCVVISVENLGEETELLKVLKENGYDATGA